MLRSVLAFSTLALVTTQTAAATYSAKLATPTSGRIIARDISWSCGADACQGATQESRPAVICEGLAKRVGRIESFLVDGRGFSEAELGRCNASSKNEPSKALAAQ